jgi:hypothetical protein
LPTIITLRSKVSRHVKATLGLQSSAPPHRLNRVVAAGDITGQWPIATWRIRPSFGLLNR